jgi:hypothetical protein
LLGIIAWAFYQQNLIALVICQHKII